MNTNFNGFHLIVIHYQEYLEKYNLLCCCGYPKYTEDLKILPGCAKNLGKCSKILGLLQMIKSTKTLVPN